MLRTDRIGALFAGYRIDALIGHGGMGEVYRAENPRLGTWLALKLLAENLARNEQFRERFVRESRAAASLDHPHVIPIFDADEWEGIPYIAMRYVEGSDLKAVMENESVLEVDRALELLDQMADALDWAHSKGLVHRDVKPANILIERRPMRKEHAYLSDFGVAKQALGRGLTSTGEFVGTIEYVAPEQIEGKAIDGRADVYALGCILFQCLAGVPPFDRDSTVGLMYAHLQEPPPVLSEKRGDLPQELDDVILRALAKSPDDRYPTASALIAGARAAAEGREAPRAAETVIRPKPATRETVVQQRSAPSSEDKSAVLVPVVETAAPEAPLAVAGATVPPGGGETVLSRRRKDTRWSRRTMLIVAGVLGAAALAAGGSYALLGGSDGTTNNKSAGITPTPEPAAPAPAAAPANPKPDPPAPPRCRIANIGGLTLAAARRRLRAGHCAVGAVGRAYSTSVLSGRVAAQRPRPGVSLRNRGKVAIVISRGPRPTPQPPPAGTNPPPPPPSGINPAPPPVAPPPPPPHHGGCRGC